MAKISQETIDQIPQLYDELKSYAAVAKRLGISTASVSKYVKKNEAIRTYSTYDGPQPCGVPDVAAVLSFSTLTDEEKESYDNFIKEYE